VRPPTTLPVTNPGGRAAAAFRARTGPLRIDVVYPAENAAITASDSNFVFGNLGTGEATLTINGAPVEVAPNGAWLAFLPVPRDGVYRLQASGGARRREATRRCACRRRRGRLEPGPARRSWRAASRRAAC
jgi:N-acetylmuramoyl-L-alanine amidase